MRVTEMERFNGHLYFYCIDNKINFLAVPVDLNKMPPIIAEGQSYTKLPKKLWDKTKQIERCEGTMLYEGC